MQRTARPTATSVADISGSSARAYRPEIDSLRAFAVVAVALSHWMPELAWPVNWGHAGVYLFFVISGYVITRGLLQERADNAGRISIWAFYKRRALRIWPIYYLSIAFFYFVWPGMGPDDVLWHISFLSNALFSVRRVMEFPGHFWSLSVEEQFYIFWPFLVLLPRRTLATICVAMLAIAPLSRWYYFSELQNIRATLYALNSNLDCLAVGSLLAVIERGKIRVPTSVIYLIGAVGVTLFTLVVVNSLNGSPAFVFSFFPTSIAYLSAWLIVWLDRRPEAVSTLCNPALMYVGRVSYGIYLYHVAVGLYLIEQTSARNLPPLEFFILAFGLTAIVASASWYLIEQPIVALGRGRPIKRWRGSVAGLTVVAVMGIPLSVQRLYELDLLPVVPLSVRVADYGPKEVEVGHQVNPQPNGASAMWMKIDAPLPGGTLAVIDGKRVTVIESFPVVTFELPPSILKMPGMKSVFLERRNMLSVERSMTVMISVE